MIPPTDASRIGKTAREEDSGASIVNVTVRSLCLSVVLVLEFSDRGIS